MTLEEREPDFDLIHPRGMGGREVKVNLAVAGEPELTGRSRRHQAATIPTDQRADNIPISTAGSRQLEGG